MSDENGIVAEQTREPRWRGMACFVLMLVALQVAVGNRVRLSQWEVFARGNSGVAEGDAWVHGRLDIGLAGRDPVHDRPHDTAVYHGKVYNVFPPLVGFLTYALAPLHRWMLGDTDVWLPWTYTLLCFWPIPIVGYLVFRRQSGDSAWGALLTASWMAGTALLPNLYFARGGQLGQLNHVLSQVGLMLIAADVLGRQRMWPAVIGLAIAVWSRQMTLLYALPLAVVAWRNKRMAMLAVGVAVIVAPLLWLNYAKFGNPLDFGYRYIYVNREAEPMGARCLQTGTFSPKFIGENAWFMFAALPYFTWMPTALHIDSDSWGTGIFFTTPLLLLTLMTVRTWWRDWRRRLLMLGTLPVIAGLMCYHSPGFMQFGYNRFALDFVPIWLVVAAPAVRKAWAGRFAIAATAWGLLYFSLIRFE